MMNRARVRALAVMTLFVASACSDSATNMTTAPGKPSVSEVKFWEVGSSVRWNKLALTFYATRGGNPGRSNTYLALAQYRAVRAAHDGKDRSLHPSVAAAVAGASAVVLRQFYPLDGASIDAELAAQRTETPWPGAKNDDFAAGEAIGRAVGAAVLAYAATDNFNVANPVVPAPAAGQWVSSAAPLVRGGYGARAFVLTSNTELMLPPPPAWGSTEYLDALAEVRSVSDNRSPAQLAIAQRWAPFGGPRYVAMAGDLIVKYKLTEAEAARVYAYGNVAAFDANIACFHNKYTYWFIRPSKADAAITTPVGLPNHPSYPSGHSCESGAWAGVLSAMFPEESEMLTGMADEAAESRLIAGLHYRFDNEQGVALGRATAALTMARGVSDQ